MRLYTVHEMFLTLQGEGRNIGRAAVFIRFAGCNLWSGREQDRSHAVCQFCDTQFVGGTRHSAESLARQARSLWVGGESPFAVLTGGEPLLQVDDALIRQLRGVGFTLALETNGTQPLPSLPLDWVCVSPKSGTALVLDSADEVKLVYPQEGLDPMHLSAFRSPTRWLSPMDGPNLSENTSKAATYCLLHPEWRLGIQAHKTWGVA